MFHQSIIFMPINFLETHTHTVYTEIEMSNILVKSICMFPQQIWDNSENPLYQASRICFADI